MLIKAALNGARSHKEHPQIPISPDQLALESKRVVEAGANALHIHPRTKNGQESLTASDISAAINAIRSVSVEVPVGISTGEWIESGINTRLARIKSWTVLPDFASVNFNEEGAQKIAHLILSRNIGLEAGINSVDAMQRFLNFARANDALRVLIEIPDLNLAQANKLLQEIESLLDQFYLKLPRLLHGYEGSAWAMIKKSVQRKYDTRIGFEDTLFLPTGQVANNNAELVRATIKIIDVLSGA